MNRGFGVFLFLAMGLNAGAQMPMQMQPPREVPLNPAAWEMPPGESIVYFETAFSSDLAPWTSVDVASSRNWFALETREDGSFASCNGYRADRGEASDDWLVSPRITVYPGQTASFEFETKKDFRGPDLQIWVLEDPGAMVADPSDHARYEITPEITLASGENWTPSGSVPLPAPDSGSAETYRIGIRYISTGAGSGDGARWGLRSPVLTIEAVAPELPEPSDPEPITEEPVEAPAPVEPEPTETETDLQPEPEADDPSRPLPFHRNRGPRGK